jgi:hypothetical protein
MLGINILYRLAKSRTWFRVVLLHKGFEFIRKYFFNVDRGSTWKSARHVPYINTERQAVIKTPNIAPYPPT